MDLTVNIWLWLSPAAEATLRGVAQIALPRVVPSGPVPDDPIVGSLAHPLANYLGGTTLDLVRNFPQRYRPWFPAGLWNCYATKPDLSDFVATREQLQELEEKYPNDFTVAGCWDYATGEPIGGVGSPWFVSPPDLVTIMPPIPQPGPGPGLGPVPPPLTGVIHDIVLGAGQAPRKFV